MRSSFLAFTGLLLGASLAFAEVVDRIAAVVNGDIILLSEVEAMVGPGLDSLEGPRRRELLERAADELISERLVLEVAEEQGLSPAPAEIDAAIENVKRENRIDDKSLEAALAQQGLTRSSYREMLGKQLTRMKVAEVKVRPRVNVTDDDVRRRYEQMTQGMSAVEERRVRDIFVPSGADPEVARAQLEAARARVLAGEAFETVARETPGPLAEAGGDLGWVNEDSILPVLASAAFSLRRGEVSAVLEGGGGFHLITVEGIRKSGTTRTLAEAREEIRMQLFSERMGKATEEWLTELRRTADVELRLP